MMNAFCFTCQFPTKHTLTKHGYIRCIECECEREPDAEEQNFIDESRMEVEDVTDAVEEIELDDYLVDFVAGLNEEERRDQ
jgi:hypothetical protein